MNGRFCSQRIPSASRRFQRAVRSSLAAGIMTASHVTVRLAEYLSGGSGEAPPLPLVIPISLLMPYALWAIGNLLLTKLAHLWPCPFIRMKG